MLDEVSLTEGLLELLTGDRLEPTLCANRLLRLPARARTRVLRDDAGRLILVVLADGEIVSVDLSPLH